MQTLTASGVREGTLGAYAGLAKPKAILPHFVTAAAAMFLAAGSPPAASTLLLTLLGGGLVAAGANVFNCIVDRDIDALMERTCRRALPSGLIKPKHALVFAAALGMAGVAILERLVNRPAAALAVLALAYYVLAYTVLLKRRTYWSAVVGSAIGAVPPLIGWVAVTDRIGPTPLLLSAIVILWTMPHFWALAMFRHADYARAGLRVLPQRGVGVSVIASSVLLVAVSLLLVPPARLGVHYAALAGILGTSLLWLASGTIRKRPLRAARHLYAYSIFYIALLFGAMIIDRLV